MAEVVNAWTATKYEMDILLMEVTAMFTGEEKRAVGPAALCITTPCIIGKHRDGGRMNGNEPGLTELALPDGHNTRIEIDIIALQPECFTEP
jgi:hypothetical protein